MTFLSIGAYKSVVSVRVSKKNAVALSRFSGELSFKTSQFSLDAISVLK